MRYHRRIEAMALRTAAFRMKEEEMESNLHYREEGTGDPLILLHGNGEDGGYFVHQIERFSQRFRTIAVDTRGHGASPRGNAPFTFAQFARDLENFLNELELPRANLLGFSDGGIIALLFALEHPDRVERMVLNGANLFPEGVEPGLRERIRAKHEAYRGNAPYEDADTQRKYELVRLMAEEPHIDPADLADLAVPTLVIAGTGDMIEEEHTRLIAASLPCAELAIIPGDHFIARDNHEAFNDAVERFLLAP